MNYLALAITLAIGLTGGLVGWLLRRESAYGWLPLAAHFPLTHRPAGPEKRLRWVSVGGRGLVGHKGAVVAGASAEGLSLRMPLLGWLWHPPLLIPWANFGPFRAEKRFLWTTRYTTLIRLPDGTEIALRFEDTDLFKALRPWVRVEEAI